MGKRCHFICMWCARSYIVVEPLWYLLQLSTHLFWMHGSTSSASLILRPLPCFQMLHGDDKHWSKKHAERLHIYNIIIQMYIFVGSCLQPKFFIGNLLAMWRGWVIIKLASDERRSTTNKLATWHWGALDHASHAPQLPSIKPIQVHVQQYHAVGN